MGQLLPIVIHIEAHTKLTFIELWKNLKLQSISELNFKSSKTNDVSGVII